LKKIKITYIVSNIDKAVAFEWTAASIDKQRFDLRFILLGGKETELEKFLRASNIPVKVIPFTGKRDYFRAFFCLLHNLAMLRPHVVHTHLFDANLLGLTAAFFTFIPKRIFTRHHGSLHHVYHSGGLKWDRWCNLLATYIVAISGVVEEILIDWEKVPRRKVIRIPHGFDLEAFSRPNSNNKLVLEKKYNPAGRKPIIGVNARFIHWKGVQYIIPAFKELLKEYPNAKLLLFGAEGNYKNELMGLLQELPKDSWETVAFENDVFHLYHLFDIYVHVPIDTYLEAFGQTYIEALAAGIPSVFTLAGIGKELIKNNKNALTVPFKESHSITIAMFDLLKNPELCQKLTTEGKKSVEAYSIDQMIQKLEDIYGDD
jgi:glycosyltransferase involved in cell wall biosynthesis